MKPWRWCSAIGLAAAGVPTLVVAMAPQHWDRSEQYSQLASLPALPPPAPATDRVWLRLKEPAPLGQLADSLNVSSGRLASLNEVAADHRFAKGDWLVVPSAQARLARLLPELDGGDLRETPPFQQPPPLQANGVVKLGDSLRKIALRYGMTLQELLRQNPGLETARLVVGAPINVVQSSPRRQRRLLAIKPTTSGGLSWPELPDFGAEEDRRLSAEGWIWPSRGIFSSGFGWRWGRMHKGIDIANNVGTPIVAAKDGVVVFSGWHSGGYGYLVTLSHPDGSRSLYAHNSRLLVQEGDEVEQGQPLAQMGSTGRSTGPHLHFEIHPPGRGAVNPLALLPQRA